MDREARKNQILRELEAESDRGCVLVAASALDVLLEELLRTSLITDPHAVKHAVTLLFEAMGPMATFSAKIKLAYGLGLIDKLHFSDLEKIRRIRNIASHEYSPMTFESQEIIEISRTLEAADLAVRSLPLPDDKSSTTPPSETPKPHSKSSKERLRFSMSVAYVAGTLDAKSEIRESKRRSAEVPSRSHES
jgi:DNA-binding MltR family transcriptional regulator